MVRVIKPNGRLADIEEVQCFKEKIVSFAEKKKRVVVVAEQFDSEVTGFMVDGIAGRIMWGNLTSEKVREILTEMTEKGYISFLDRGFDVIDSPKKIPMLNGRPYFLEEKPCWNHPQMGFGMGCGMNPQNGCFGEEEDVFLDEDDESM